MPAGLCQSSHTASHTAGCLYIAARPVCRGTAATPTGNVKAGWFHSRPTTSRVPRHGRSWMPRAVPGTAVKSCPALPRVIQPAGPGGPYLSRLDCNGPWQKGKAGPLSANEKGAEREGAAKLGGSKTPALPFLLNLILKTTKQETHNRNANQSHNAKHDCLCVQFWVRDAVIGKHKEVSIVWKPRMSGASG